ncbi:MAG: LacI family DNA-binding transcriptional regulator [Chloroflexota bacterium]
MNTTSRVTIDDVAREAGVSIATVSRVLNKTGPVAEATAARVLEVVAALNYVPHAGARGLAGGRRRTIGLIFPGVADEFLSELLRGIEQQTLAEGYKLLLYATGWHPEERTLADLPLGEHNTDGLLVFGGSLSEAELTHFWQRALPIVLLYQSAPAGLRIPTVAFENKEGARQAVTHLLACGRRRIVFLRGPEGNEDSYWRERGYEEALAAYGLAVDPALAGRGGFDDGIARTAVSHLLQSGIDFDAIFAGDDKAASGALYALQQAGKRVPEDVALVGFDDAPYSRYLTPPLTTVRAPIGESGQVAAEMLSCLIRGEETALKTLLPTALVVRESCGSGLAGAD